MALLRYSYSFMHGTYTHRVTCNLYPVQYYTLERAAERAKTRLAPFVRDAALAYLDQRIVLPPEFSTNLFNIHCEISRGGAGLNEIAERARTIGRITHTDLKDAGDFVRALDQQTMMLRNEVDSLPAVLSLPHDHQIDGS